MFQVNLFDVASSPQLRSESHLLSLLQQESYRERSYLQRRSPSPVVSTSGANSRSSTPPAHHGRPSSHPPQQHSSSSSSLNYFPPNRSSAHVSSSPQHLAAAAATPNDSCPVCQHLATHPSSTNVADDDDAASYGEQGGQQHEPREMGWDAQPQPSQRADLLSRTAEDCVRTMHPAPATPLTNADQLVAQIEAIERKLRTGRRTLLRERFSPLASPLKEVAPVIELDNAPSSAAAASPPVLHSTVAGGGGGESHVEVSSDFHPTNAEPKQPSLSTRGLVVTPTTTSDSTAVNVAPLVVSSTSSSAGRLAATPPPSIERQSPPTTTTTTIGPSSNQEEGAHDSSPSGSATQHPPRSSHGQHSSDSTNAPRASVVTPSPSRGATSSSSYSASPSYPRLYERPVATTAALNHNAAAAPPPLFPPSPAVQNVSFGSAGESYGGGENNNNSMLWTPPHWAQDDHGLVMTQQYMGVLLGKLDQLLLRERQSTTTTTTPPLSSSHRSFSSERAAAASGLVLERLHGRMQERYRQHCTVIEGWFQDTSDRMLQCLSRSTVALHEQLLLHTSAAATAAKQRRAAASHDGEEDGNGEPTDISSIVGASLRRSFKLWITTVDSLFLEFSTHAATLFGRSHERLLDTQRAEQARRSQLALLEEVRQRQQREQKWVLSDQYQTLLDELESDYTTNWDAKLNWLQQSSVALFESYWQQHPVASPTPVIIHVLGSSREKEEEDAAAAARTKKTERRRGGSRAGKGPSGCGTR